MTSEETEALVDRLMVIAERLHKKLVRKQKDDDDKLGNDDERDSSH